MSICWYRNLIFLFNIEINVFLCVLSCHLTKDASSAQLCFLLISNILLKARQEMMRTSQPKSLNISIIFLYYNTIIAVQFTIFLHVPRLSRVIRQSRGT